MFTKLLHIGFAVNSIDETMKSLSKLGAVEIGRKHFEKIGQVSALIEIADTRYELMEPIGDVGVVPKYIREHGEGFHHLSFLCDDADEEAQRLMDEGVRLLGKEPGDGKHKFFTHPKSSGGILLEITDQPD